MGKGGSVGMPTSPAVLRSTVTSLADDDGPSPAKRPKPDPAKQSKSGQAHTLVPVTNPATGETIAQVEMCTKADVDATVAAAQAALPGWAGLTSKRRAAIMLKFHALVMEVGRGQAPTPLDWQMSKARQSPAPDMPLTH